MGEQGIQGLINGYRNGLGLLLKPQAAAEIARLEIAAEASAKRDSFAGSYGVRQNSVAEAAD